MKPRISVAIPTMGRDTLMATLRSLERQTIMPLEVLVVNQGAPEVEQQANFNLPLKFLHQDVRGLSRARNRALQAFAGDWVLFTDDDQEVNAEWVEQLGVLATAYPEASIIGGAVFPPPRYNRDEEFVSQLYVLGEVPIDPVNYLRPEPVLGLQNDVWGGNFALSRACVDKVGIYDEAFGRGSGVFDVGEDTDYMMRVLSAGLTGLLSCRLIIYHTFGGRPHSPQFTKDTVEMAAALLWKSQQENAPIRPDIAERLFPYGRKKALLSKFTGGRLFGDHTVRKTVFDDAMAMLERDYTLRDGLLARKAGHV